MVIGYYQSFVADDFTGTKMKKRLPFPTQTDNGIF